MIFISNNFFGLFSKQILSTGGLKSTTRVEKMRIPFFQRGCSINFELQGRFFNFCFKNDDQHKQIRILHTFFFFKKIDQILNRPDSQYIKAVYYVLRIWSNFLEKKPMQNSYFFVVIILKQKFKKIRCVIQNLGYIPPQFFNTCTTVVSPPLKS